MEDHDDTDRPALSPELAHPRAREILTDPFFWDVTDEGAPLGTETGAEILTLFRAERAGADRGSLVLLEELLARWEVTDGHWEVVDAATVASIGAEDEYGVLMRDEILLGLAFAELVETGCIDPVVQRRAHRATARQALPMLLAPWGNRTLERATRLERMGQVLARPLR